MEQSTYTVILITAENTEEAEKIGETLVKRRLAACVNIIPEIRSLFWWDDKIDSSKESLLVVKTLNSRLTDIIKAIKEIHSYTVPEIIALPIVGGNPDYLDWIKREVA